MIRHTADIPAQRIGDIRKTLLVRAAHTAAESKGAF